MAQDVQVRPAVATDRAFIFATWLKSLRFGSELEEVPPDLYYEGQHRIIEQLLDRCMVLVAHAPEDPDTLLGWAVMDPLDGFVLHYVYVKGAFRRLGIAKALLAGWDLVNMQYSHRTGALAWFKAKVPSARFNPFAIHKGATDGQQSDGPQGS